MNRERLEYLARKILPFVQPDKFDIGWWLNGDITTTGKICCCTSACAFGYMALSPKGKKDGIRWNNETPAYKGYRGLHAASSYFEINWRETCWLFDPIINVENLEIEYENDIEHENEYENDGTISPSIIASRIESLLAAEAL